MVRLEEDWTGKNIFLKTDTGKFVTGKVLSHKDETLKILDKFNMMVYIFEKEIVNLEERK